MGSIHVTSEIGILKKVLLHRPGNELLNLTPDTLERLLTNGSEGSTMDLICSNNNFIIL